MALVESNGNREKRKETLPDRLGGVCFDCRTKCEHSRDQAEGEEPVGGSESVVHRDQPAAVVMKIRLRQPRSLREAGLSGGRSEAGVSVFMAALSGDDADENFFEWQRANARKMARSGHTIL